MKKTVSIFLAALLIAGSLSTSALVGAQEAASEDKIQIVTTIFPI